jgi:hypothetical protein
MSPTKPTKHENPKASEASNPVPAASAASPPAEANTKADPSASADGAHAKANGKPGKPKNTAEGTRIISVAIPERLARQVKLLCSVTGTTAQALVQSALQKAVNKQLASALESIKPEVDG